jgi:M-phase inducer tyrosine phosphatase
MKRPALATIPPADESRSGSSTSAYPILQASKASQFPRVAPMRRAYSVCDQNMPESEEETECEDSPSTAAEYAKRIRVTPRADGSPGFKPMRCSIAAVGDGVVSPLRKKTSPYGPGGMPGFGDNELEGKILPCHKVKEDGLVRITPQTVSVLCQF